MNEEVESDIADNEDDMADETLPKRGKKTGGLNDPFFMQDGDEVIETVEEKKMKMTKQLLAELEQPSGKLNDFFENLHAKGEAEAEIFGQEDDMLTKRLKYQILEKKGKLFYNIADDYLGGEFDRVFLKGHKKAITALEWGVDNKSIFTASKDCSLI